MKVYLQDTLIFEDFKEAACCILNLPVFALGQIVPISISDDRNIYQVSIYCFDDEVDLSMYD